MIMWMNEVDWIDLRNWTSSVMTRMEREKAEELFWGRLNEAIRVMEKSDLVKILGGEF